MTMPFRWGILGGRSGIYQRRLKPAFESTDRHPVVAEASRSDDGLGAYDAVLARDDLEAVYIPLPNALHAPWILRALDAGKHVLCEKPLTMTAADTEHVVAAARASGLALVEAYMAPHHPRFQLVQTLAREGGLGTLHLHRGAFTFTLDRPADHRWDLTGGGALLDVGVYCLAPALDLAEREPLDVAAAATINDAGVDTSMTGWLDFGDGFQAMFEVSFQAPFRRRQEIVGSDGALSIDDPVPGPDEPGQLTIERDGDRLDHIPTPGGDAFVAMLDQFAAVARGEAAPVFDLDASIRLARTLERLRAAAGLVRFETHVG
jgi:predicted dehydrogenase